jgi:hypothetical protein
MTEWDKNALRTWVHDLESNVFLSMDGVGSKERVVVTADQLLERYPQEDDTSELLNCLCELCPAGVFIVMRDKWSRVPMKRQIFI